MYYSPVVIIVLACMLVLKEFVCTVMQLCAMYD